MTEINPLEAEHTIPQRELLDWYEAERRDIRREQEQLERMRQIALLDGQDINRDLEAKHFRTLGRQDTLRGFAAFLIDRTTQDKKEE